jgi:hypothetical protein
MLRMLALACLLFVGFGCTKTAVKEEPAEQATEKKDAPPPAPAARKMVPITNDPDAR